MVVDTATRAEPATGASFLRVLIVDDHAVVRTGTRQVLETSGDIAVVGEADCGAAAFALVDALVPDMALVDVQLVGESGIDVASQIKRAHPGVRVVMLSGYDDDALVRNAFEVGAAGYLSKTMARQELIEAVRAAGRGEMVVDHSRVTALPAKVALSGGPGGGRLTWRERETVELVAQGLTNRAIARRMGVSVRTVEGHLSHVFAKLGIESRTELVRRVLTGELAW